MINAFSGRPRPILLKAVRSEDTSKDYFIIVNNKYNYLSILTVGQKPVHARAQIRH